MEFKFSVNEILQHPIVEINQNLLPPGFNGDRRTLWDTTTKISEIVNAMGDASAVAQGLTKPITTSDRLRNTDQTIYLLLDQNAKDGKGVVTGMLKTGRKSLYVFDRDGHHYQVSPPCVLDFYVHESRQRTGLGKQLFEHMLQKEKVEPVKLAVDRPSEKLLSFLNKHYGLNNPLRQMNNYVVFDGFFPEPVVQDVNGDGSVSESPSRSKQAANGLQQNFASPYGRYGAPRPPCSMGQIIHNQSPVQSNEPSGVSLNIRPTRGTAKSAPALQKQRQQQMQQQMQGYSNPMQTGICQSVPNMTPQQQVYNMAQHVNPNMMQQLTNPNITQQQINPNIAQQQMNPSNMIQQQQQMDTSMIQQPVNPAMAQQQINPNITQQQINPNMAQQQRIPNMPPQQINPSMAQQQIIPNMPQQQIHPNMAQQQINPNMTQQQINPNVTQQQMNPNIVQQQQMSPNMQYYNQQMQSPRMTHLQNQPLDIMQQLPVQMNLHGLHIQQQLQQQCLNNGISPRVDQSGQPVSDHAHYYSTDPYKEERAPQQKMVASQPNVQHLQQGYSPNQQQIAHIHHPQGTPSFAPLQTPQFAQRGGGGMEMIQPQQEAQPTTIPLQMTQSAPIPQQQVMSPHQPSTPVPQQMVQQPVQHNPNINQQLSVPNVLAAAQQQIQPAQSVPALQATQTQPNLAQYQQRYVQPPNTEQPMQMKPVQYVPQPSRQSTTAPYQYYDSATAAMQANYTHSQPYLQQTPHSAPSPRIPAGGDMPPLQKSPEYYTQQQQSQQQLNMDNAYISPNTAASTPRVPEQMTQVAAVNSGGAGGIYQQQQPLSEPRKPLDDSISQSPKLERPRSLSIQRSEDSDSLDKKIAADDVKSEVQPTDEADRKQDNELDNIENDVEKIEITENVISELQAAVSSTNHSVNGSDDSENRSKSPNPLTSQGYFDLKFYHSRLW